MSTFVAVPAEALRAHLGSLGFTPVEGRWTEEVYERRRRTFPRYVVRVYSTIPVGGAGVRGRGGEEPSGLFRCSSTRQVSTEVLQGAEGVPRRHRRGRAGEDDGAVARSPTGSSTKG